MRYAKFVYGSFTPDFTASGWLPHAEFMRRAGHAFVRESRIKLILPEEPIDWRWRKYVSSLPETPFREVQR